MSLGQKDFDAGIKQSSTKQGTSNVIKYRHGWVLNNKHIETLEKVEFILAELSDKDSEGIKCETELKREVKWNRLGDIPGWWQGGQEQHEHCLLGHLSN